MNTSSIVSEVDDFGVCIGLLTSTDANVLSDELGSDATGILDRRFSFAFPRERGKPIEDDDDDDRFFDSTC